MHIIILSFCFAIFLQGCSSTFSSTDAASHAYAARRIDEAKNISEQSSVKPAGLVRIERRVRFAGNAMPLVESNILPANIQSVTIKYPGRHNLSTIADVIARTIEVPVIMAADALMDPRSFSPIRGASSLVATAPVDGDPTNLVSPLAMQAGSLRIGLTPTQANTTFELNYSGPLVGLLDKIATQAQLQWSYEGEAIIFRRVVTQVIAIKNLPGGIKSSGSIGISLAGGSSTFSSDGNSEFWDGINRSLSLMVSTNGQIQIDPKLGLITVRDAISNVREIQRYMSYVNKTLVRQVNIKVEVVQVDLNSEAQSGIDWTGVSRVVAGSYISSSGPGFVTGNSTPSNIGVYKGASQFLFKALEKYGRVSTAYSTSVSTLHRQPVPVSVTNSKTYLRSVTAGVTSSAGFSSGPTLGVADLVTGFGLTMLPVILDSNQVLMEASISVSAARELSQYSTGAGSSQTTLQQPSVDNIVNIQRVRMGLGETLVLLGYEYNEVRNSAIDIVLDKLPTSRLSLGAKKAVIVLLTPTLYD